MTHGKFILCPALLLALGTAACGGEGAGLVGDEAGADGVASALDGAAAVLTQDSAPRPRGPDEIYYDLTAYDWYRRGEVLVAAGFAFQPQGLPRVIPFDSLRRAGNYQGVDFYVKNGAAEPYDTVFVPVFEDFWQPFLPVGPATPTPPPSPAPAEEG
ncbi:MAG TPA: hypothetical protein VIL18_04020 [Longimicrobiales bacterium]